VVRPLSRASAIVAIRSLRDDLDSALAEIEQQRRSGNLSVPHQSFLNDYAVVRMAGYLEQLCFLAISGRIGEATNGHVQTFVNSWFYKSPNLTSSQFSALFARFGPEIAERIKQFLEEHLNRDLLNSLLETRNAVAHGKEFSRSGRGNLQSYRVLVADIDRVVHELMLEDASII
jgi:hypothetical protein